MGFRRGWNPEGMGTSSGASKSYLRGGGGVCVCACVSRKVCDVKEY